MLAELRTLKWPHSRLFYSGRKIKRSTCPGVETDFEFHYRVLTKTLGSKEAAQARLNKLGRGTPDLYAAFMLRRG